MSNSIKPIAFYLPQFHPIPENDEWWGKGFTEWTNVTKAKPLFEGHYQPRLPADLGFYDLRVAESRKAQAQMAKDYGIYGFCYWHYWFAGKQVLEQPFNEAVKSGEPDFPFCLAWANQTWEGTWHGLSSNKVLIEQTYPGSEDHEEHFYSLLPAFKDDRYIEVDGKKLFSIFQPLHIPGVQKFISQWQQLAIENGLNGFHFVGLHVPYDSELESLGFDASVQEMTPWVNNLQPKIKYNFFRKLLREIYIPKNELKQIPRKVSYKNMVENYPENKLSNKQYPMLFCDWDNTPRSGFDGWLFTDFSLQIFEEHFIKACKETENKSNSGKLIFVKSWNEWAEGNYLEPDRKYGNALLESLRNALNHYDGSNIK